MSMMLPVVVALTLASQPGALTVEITSNRPGLVFTDRETPEAAVRVSGAGDTADVAWSVSETGGGWEAAGLLAVDVKDGSGRAPLPLALPGRGHYTLEVTASSQGMHARAVSSMAVVFEPKPPVKSSPWGIFHLPHGDTPDTMSEAEAIALSHRLLGASWSRLNFWGFSHGTVSIETRDGQPHVTGEWDRWKEYARALRAEGIHIMGEVAQVPAALSSREGATDRDGPWGGELQYRVPPRDYAEWDSFVENLAARFRDEIGVWEIWNEPDLREFWGGTPEEFMELVAHTSAALRRGNPDTRIVASGFTLHGHQYADRLFEMGLADHIDILSVHYTDERPGTLEAWHDLLERHGLDLPIWNTEERSNVPLRNLSGGIEVNFKFLHIDHGPFPEYWPLVNPDYTPNPSGVEFSVGAYCIGDARPEGRSDAVPGYGTFFFRRGAEQVAAFRRGATEGFVLPPEGVRVVLDVDLVGAGAHLTVTDRYGRRREVPVDNGRVEVELREALLYLTGAARIEIKEAEAFGEPVVYERQAESGRHSAGWSVSEQLGFLDGKVLSIWSDEEPGPEGHFVELDFSVAEAGSYQVIYSGNKLDRLAPPPSISPFTWSIDGIDERRVDTPRPRLEGAADVGDGLYALGTVELEEGEHTLRLTLTDRRESPDNRYALWLDAILLRHTGPTREGP